MNFTRSTHDQPDRNVHGAQTCMPRTRMPRIRMARTRIACISLGLGLSLSPLLGALPACAQTGRLHRSASGAGMQPASSLQPGPIELPPLPTAGEIVREIDDAANGDRWLLIDNRSRPGAPGRLLRAASAGAAAGQNRQPALNPERARPSADAETAAGVARASPVIRGGDRLIVEEHTAVVDARLAAVAMAPAWMGAPFSARLVIGGRVVQAVATGPGTATLAPPSTDPQPRTGARP